MSELLNSLIFDLSIFPDEAAKIKATQDVYERTYCFGRKKLHDGVLAKFDPFQFGHAFYTEPEETKYTTKSKLAFCVHRASRVKWIEHVISGSVENCEVYRVPPERPSPANGPQRLYVYWGGPYIVWMKPRREQFLFSTAYIMHRERLLGKLKFWKAIKIA